MLSSRRLTAVTIGSCLLSFGLWGAGYLPSATAAPAATDSSVKYYFHGAGQGQDDVNRSNFTPSATFSTTAPTGTSDSTQTPDDPVANEAAPANPFLIYWIGTVPDGTYSGTLHLDWWWQAPNPSDSVFVNNVNITVWTGVDESAATGTQIGGANDVPVNAPPTAPGESTADVPINGAVSNNLVIQVKPSASNTGTTDTAHYGSTTAPSWFTLPAGTAPTPTPTPTDSTPPPSCTSLCFSKPLVLPQSGDTGGTDKTCFNPCGEPSLVKSPVDGQLYVSTPRTIVACCNTKASPVWTSSDDGETWSNPIFPPGVEDATTGGDTELAVDKRGTVYEGELWLGSDSIYISSDKGANWDWSPTSHDLLADREWFAYEPIGDALYGFYDGFKGLMVVKAPLNTPLGSNAARFFPDEHLVVPECAAAVAVNCPDVPVDSVNGTPVIHDATSPGRPSVGPDGTVYFPFPYQVANKGIGIAYTSDGGSTFNYSYVAGAGHGGLHDTGNDFPVSAVDSAGRLYVAWVENKGDGFNVYLASSGDKGATWSGPTELSQGVSKTAVFPNVVAGAAGQVAVSWYGTDALGDNNDANAMVDKNGNPAPWNVYVDEITGAGGSSQSITTGVVEYGFHKGVICTQGTGCTGDTRKLLDFFDTQFDAQGRLGVVYTRDLGASGTEIVYSHQTTGCLLTSSCTIGANLAEFPTQIAPVFFGVAVFGGLVLFRRRRRTAAP